MHSWSREMDIENGRAPERDSQAEIYRRGAVFCKPAAGVTLFGGMKILSEVDSSAGSQACLLQ